MTAIGIDFGTSCSRVAAFRHNGAEIIPNERGNKTTPTYVSFTEEELLIGDKAMDQAVLNPVNTIFDIKRIIGRKFSDPIIQSNMKYWPFKIIQGDSDRPKIEVQWKNETKHFYPEEICAMVLGKLKEDAENLLKEKVTDAVITVPTSFNSSQRQALKDAGEISGLNVLRIVNEPSAAAVALDLNEKFDEQRNVIIFDFGSGMLDVSLLEIEKGSIEVIAAAGDANLGGEDLDNQFLEHLADRFKHKFKCDLRQSPKATRTLKRECERAKITLSTYNSYIIFCESLYEDHDYLDSLSRRMFDCIDGNLLLSILNPVKQVLNEAKMSKNEVKDIFLLGGSSEIPKARQLLQDFFDGKQIFKTINLDEAVACGAAVQAAIIKNSSAEEIKDILLLDTISFSLGIEVAGEIMTVIIPKNTYIPAKKRHVFTTFSDNQTAATIKIYEGESLKTENNNLLGFFDYTGIPPAPKGVPQIEVTFNINADNVIEVFAKEISTRNVQKITIEKDKGLKPHNDINKMIVDSEK